jgi:hypothetical protein
LEFGETHIRIVQGKKIEEGKILRKMQETLEISGQNEVLRISSVDVLEQRLSTL